jgi:urease accessory protein
MRPAVRVALSIGASAAVFVAVCPAPAEAHLNATGIGPVYDGMAHFLMSPEDLVPVLALALLAGLRGPSYGRQALFVLPTAWLIGGLLGLPESATNGSAVVSALWFLLLGGLVAADVQFPLVMATLLAVLLGLDKGYLNGAGMGRPETAVIALTGLASAVFVMSALASALVLTLRAQWTRIAVRVAGSWVAAIGLLMLGWAFRAR